MSVLDMFRLDGKVVIVTGASAGLGVAFAKASAEAGASVVLAARRVEKLAETKSLVESAGAKALTVATDVADPEACAALVDAAMAEFGQVDVLINNAGVGTAVPATRETVEQFRSSRASSASPPPVYRRPPMPPARPASSGSPATSPSSGEAEKAYASTRSRRASSPRR